MSKNSTYPITLSLVPFTMFSNYIKITIRNIIKHKAYSIINVTGLSIGLAIFCLTAELFKFQMTFNQFHKDADRIYSWQLYSKKLFSPCLFTLLHLNYPMQVLKFGTIL